MKVRVIKDYYDGAFKRKVKTGETLQVNSERAKQLLGKRLVEEFVETAMLEEKTEKAVRKTRKKKVEVADEYSEGNNSDN